MHISFKKIASFGAALSFMFSAATWAGFDGRNPTEYNVDQTDRLAIQGYDPVAYYPEGGSKALKGDPQLEVDHEGIKYHFANSQNMDAFLLNPSKYEPTYGGWCATAMAFNQRIAINPNKFILTNDRLFLFSTLNGADASVMWKNDATRLERRADRNWQRQSGETSKRIVGFEGRNSSEYNVDKSIRLAIQGYDPVSYHPEGGSNPQIGEDDFEIDYAGVRYKFASQSNLDTFLATPNKYEPAYGGWCATAMAFNQKITIDPLKYVLDGDRLFLFSFLNGSDAKQMWDANPASLERRANRNWTQISGEPAQR